MTIRSALGQTRDSIAYWSQWFLLQMFGPATQDMDNDPVEQLKRKYRRRP